MCRTAWNDESAWINVQQDAVLKTNSPKCTDKLPVKPISRNENESIYLVERNNWRKY